MSEGHHSKSWSPVHFRPPVGSERLSTSYTLRKSNWSKLITDEQGMSRRHLLLCFDAFGTLFTPRKPVHQQYAEVARSLGLSGIKDDDVQAQFKKGPQSLHAIPLQR